MPIPIAGLLSGAAKIAGATRSRGSGAKLAGSIVKRKPKKTEEDLPQRSKSSSALAIRPKQSLVPYQNIEPVPPTDGMNAGDKVVVIHTKIIEIDNLLKGTLAADKNLIDQRNQQQELEEEKKREEKLEKKDDKEKKPDKNKLNLPRMGFFGAIGNFITNVVLGFILTRLVDHAPKLEGIIKGIASAIEWTSDFVIGFVDALGTFLKIGYDAYKEFEGFIENTFGEDGVKALHGFTDALSSFFNAVVIVGMAAAAVGDEFDFFNRRNNKSPKPGQGIDPETGKPRKPKVNEIVDPDGKIRTKTNPETKLKNMGLDDDQIRAYNKAKKVKPKPKPKPKGFLSGLGDGLKKVGKSVLDATTGSIGRGFNKISGGNLGRLGDFLGEQYNNVSKGVRNKFDQVVSIGGKLKSKFGPAMDRVKGAIGKLSESAKKTVVQKIIEPLKPFLDPVIKRLKGIGNLLMDKLSKMPGAEKIDEVLKKKGINGIGDTDGILKKVGGKALPIVGGLFNLLFAYDRLAGGDTFGALLEFASAGFDISGLASFVPGPIISTGIDAYMFVRDFIPLLQEGEENVINSIGLGGLKSNLDSAASKLPDLGSIIKKFTGGDKENQTTTGQSQSGSTGSGSTGSGNTGGQPQNMESQGTAGMDINDKGNAIYLHWTAGNYTSIGGPYHTVFTGDGTMHRKFEYGSSTGGHTYNRNSGGSVGLSLAANPDKGQWPTEDQRVSMAKESARIAKAWGWTAGDINMEKVMTHGEAGSNVDGRNAHTNYGPFGRGRSDTHSDKDNASVGQVAPVERWDLDKLNSHDDVYGSGGDEMRERIKGFMRKGGLMTKGTYEVGEEGSEFIIDADSTAALLGKYPGFLSALNRADGQKTIDVLENYASYDDPKNRVIVIEGEPEEPSLPAVAQRSMTRFISAATESYNDFTEFLVGQG